MRITVHIPTPLLRAIDRRAAAIKLSRNRFIVDSLERAVERETQWPQQLWTLLGAAGPKDVAAVEEMLSVIERART